MWRNFATLAMFEDLFSIIKDLFFNEIDLLTEDTNKETSLFMISLIVQLKDNLNNLITKVITESEIN